MGHVAAQSELFVRSPQRSDAETGIKTCQWAVTSRRLVRAVKRLLLVCPCRLLYPSEEA